jgi:hypothetical protein
MTEKAGLPVIPDSREDDLHPSRVPENSQLNLFMAGNQFMVMEALIAAFRQQHPHIERIYYYICKLTRSPNSGNAEILTRRLNRQALGSIGDLWMFEVFHNPSGQLLQFPQM